MKTKVDTAVLNKSLHLGSAAKMVKRRFSWPLSRQSSVVLSEAPSQTPSAGSSAPQASGNSSAVHQVEKDIKKMKLKDPDDRSSVSHMLNERLTAEPRQTNQDPCQLRYFLKTSERCSYRGLLNQGATCYLNATLQVLFMTEAFRERVLLTPGDTSEKLESALKELFEELSKQDRDGQSVSTTGVIKALGIERAYEQQDAVEYFLGILEKVGPNLAEVFSGTMRNNRICSENHESHDDSSFKSLQIALNPRDGPYRLEDGVESYFASTKLVGDDQMYCENCDEKSDTIWICEIHEYPSILALHLKRFVYDYWSCRFEKNDCPMDVPLHLSLQGQEYWLYAVINHRGSRYGGHYTADIRSSTENKWYCFDDSRVTETDESKLKRSSEAYLLLYQKMDSPPGYEKRKETLNSPTDLTDPRTEHLLPSVTERQRSTGPSPLHARHANYDHEVRCAKRLSKIHHQGHRRHYPTENESIQQSAHAPHHCFKPLAPKWRIKALTRHLSFYSIKKTPKGETELQLTLAGLGRRSLTITENMTHSEELEKSPDIKSCNSNINEVLTEKTAECPLCKKTFDSDVIEIHTANCGLRTAEYDDNFSDSINTLQSSGEILNWISSKVDQTNTFSICISRNDIYNRGLQQWQRRKKSSPKGRLMVNDEAGVDSGALSKEFLTEMIAEIEARLFIAGVDKKGKNPVYCLNSLDRNYFRSAGEIMAVSLAQGGPPPVFLREWCFRYLCSGDYDSIQVTTSDVTDLEFSLLIEKVNSTDDMSELTDEILSCGYTGKVSADMKSNIIRAIVLHSTMRVVPMLDQLRKGLQLYDLQKVMEMHPDLCLPLFVPGEKDDKVDAGFILENFHPVFSDKGSVKYTF